MVTTHWRSGADPPGYDARLSLANFIYDASRQADYLLRDLAVRVLPDEGQFRHMSHDADAWLIPAIAGVDAILPSDDGYLVYGGREPGGGLEVIWTVYTAQTGGPGTVLGDFPAAHHADVVAAVIAIFVQRMIYAVDATTRQFEDPLILRGLFNGINSYSRVQSDSPGWLQSVISANAIAYVADERTPQIDAALTIGPLEHVDFGIGDGTAPVTFRRYDVATGVWSDVAG